ncbi:MULTISPECIES: PTS sugar transporter subunit IIA [unclassified Amedibacterium]|uniref:PTS sugar transporter subunit IIA n=1 Tax=unclassified Amedibacterium TaxID=3088137 RepID=UPI000E3F684E|nr:MULTISPECIES: PTS sugar transporter subunit IIA [unclassified Absiella]RGB69211.1 PTS sugar transporter subunit IIA [Absiella sp. AM09-45]RGB79193.1 PTS sugar transporter subunit IIA [Absiella sp. AM09-50]RGC22350.1 PTS sugar transporter subunit IIA [Absiella sp. AM54-8XD]RGC53731.1 PTS sugar transporter subunit IIA [Absiella sp. AM29-15]
MICKELVMVNEPVTTQEEAINRLCKEAETLGLLNNQEEYKKAVYQREHEFSTAVGFDVAIPHGMSDAVNEAFIAYMKTEKEINWGEAETKPVELIFMIGVPLKDKNVLHLKFISQISKNLMKPEFREHLKSCNTKEEAFEFLKQINDDIRKEIVCL